MQKIKYFILGSLFLMVGISCDTRERICPMGSFEYLIFGHFYGKCVGEGCVEIFKIDANHLYEDSKDQYPGSEQPYDGTFTKLSNEKYELVKDLVDSFPVELFSEQDTVIGIPDGGDWGGAYVEISYFGDSGRSGYWLLDQLEANMPQGYNDFVDKINEKIVLINQ